MKILVPVKRVIDYTIRIRVKADGSGVETAGIKHSINPFDEIAVEEAVRLKEKGAASEVVVVSLGADLVQEQLRAALALGADRAIHVATDALIQPLSAAKLLKAVVDREQPGMVIMGKQAIDDDANQTGQMLAALLNWPQGTFASKVDLQSDHVLVTREVDGGLMTVKLALPALITTDLRLNEPRYATLPNIMKAKSKPLAKINASEFSVDLAPRLSVVKVEEPGKRQRGIRVKDAAELAEKLREARVIP